MAETDLEDLLNPRDELDKPGYYLDSSDESYRMLLAALDLGWMVEEPVYLRPRWYEGDQWVFHFIIKKNPTNPPRLITVRHSLDVLRLVLNEGWKFDRYPIHMETSPYLKEEAYEGSYISDLLHSQLPS